MRVSSSPARPPRGRGRHKQREASDLSIWIPWLRSQAQAHRWHIVAALAVCLAATVIGLLGPRWLARRNVGFTGPRITAAGPASPPARVCGSKAVLGGGPASPPAGAV